MRTKEKENFEKEPFQRNLSKELFKGTLQRNLLRFFIGNIDESPCIHKNEQMMKKN
jgi:hypothetical protein